ncbi:MAG TPA: DUF4450 domain-containing protein [Opitutaceae bacterium]|nr:DUF4450 domain-containing protein [Opitutaceae bacterium]
MLSPRILIIALLVVIPAWLRAQEIGVARVTPNLVTNIDRPLRYHPEGEDFVIENGTEFFNRSLYGGNTAFRVDGGDKPEFVLYLPGRGGNLRLGVATKAGAKWLIDAAQIETRYRPGELLYRIRDPLLGSGGELRLAALAYDQVEGLIVRVEAKDVAPGVQLFWAYGGVNGQRGKRDGDIGTEKVPISEWFQLQPSFCRGNRIEITPTGFVLQAKPATITGVVPPGAVMRVIDASAWNDAVGVEQRSQEPGVRSQTPEFGSRKANRGQSADAPEPADPIVIGRVALADATPVYLSLVRKGTASEEDLDTYAEAGGAKTDGGGRRAEDGGRREKGKTKAERETRNAKREIPEAPAASTPDAAEIENRKSKIENSKAAFAEAEAHFTALRDRVRIDTPDPYLNAAVGALNVAADAVWDAPQHGIMHGAIAWRTRLLGWRGPYALDALGWHERFRENALYWFGRQNTGPIPAKIPPPDEKANLARNEAGLHTNGDISHSHYDMNLVFIDAVFRHLQWTGDLTFARQAWPVIVRHLAWERRLFRREYGPDKLPLYEAYAAIWASDDLQYDGGGAMHATAYNYYENRQAARLARILGEDPTPYQQEADLLARSMRALLWVTPGKDETGETFERRNEAAGKDETFETSERRNGNGNAEDRERGKAENGSEEKGETRNAEGENGGPLAGTRGHEDQAIENTGPLAGARSHEFAEIENRKSKIENSIGVSELTADGSASPQSVFRNPPLIGWFAEYKDWLGLQRVHPSAALWTFYHTVDSEVPTPEEAWSMSQQVDAEIPHLPVRGPGVPPGLYTLGTSDWMPYDWSINNVVMAEAVHGALALWEAGRPEEAFTVTKGSLLAAMYMGISPGNVGSMSYLDVYRRESQRDFADGSGVLSRALIEGLFGVKIDRLAGDVRVTPGWPAAWDHAAIRHPDFVLSYRRNGDTDAYAFTADNGGEGTRRPTSEVSRNGGAEIQNQKSKIENPEGVSKLTAYGSANPQLAVRDPQLLALRLVVIARADRVANVTVNGKPTRWRVVEDSIARPRIEIDAPAADSFDVQITWAGNLIGEGTERRKAKGERRNAECETRNAKGETRDANGETRDAKGETGMAVGAQGQGSGSPTGNAAFVQVGQGEMRWWRPAAGKDETKGTSESRNREVSKGGKGAGEGGTRNAKRENQTAGNENQKSKIENAEGVSKLTAYGSTIPHSAVRNPQSEVDLAPYFNDRVTQIFKNQYRAPRSPFVSLALPKQGIGGWAGGVNRTADIDDAGLRAEAAKGGGRIVLPNGVAFATPGDPDARNILFTSQWDNYPPSATVSLGGRAHAIYLLMAGSTDPMQSRFENGAVTVTYTDGSTTRLPLVNPTNWWPIEQDYFIDDYQFRRPGPLPIRVDLKTGRIRVLRMATFKGTGGVVRGGAATVLSLTLDPDKDLKSLTVSATANDVVIGLMAATLAR